MNEDIKLLPCPFCGEEAEFDSPCNDPSLYAAMCGGCDFTLMTGRHGIGWHKSKEMAAKSWNTRYVF